MVFLYSSNSFVVQLHGGDSDILMQTKNDINQNYGSNSTMTTTTTYHSNPSTPTPSIGNSHDITTSLLSSSSTTTTTAAVAEMSQEEHIYEELLMMLHEQELPPLSGYITKGLGVRGDEDYSWWTSFDQDPFWASINF